MIWVLQRDRSGNEALSTFIRQCMFCSYPRIKGLSQMFTHEEAQFSFQATYIQRTCLTLDAFMLLPNSLNKRSTSCSQLRSKHYWLRERKLLLCQINQSFCTAKQPFAGWSGDWEGAQCSLFHRSKGRVLFFVQGLRKQHYPQLPHCLSRCYKRLHLLQPWMQLSSCSCPVQALMQLRKISTHYWSSIQGKQ